MHEEAATQLVQALSVGKSAILIGATGSGKTYLVDKACRQLGFDCVVFDASFDLDTLQANITELCSTKTLTKTVIVIEDSEVLDLSFLEDKLAKTTNPFVIITTNQKSIRPKLKNKCEVIRLKEPRYTDSIEITKTTAGAKIDYTKVSQDIRQTLIAHNSKSDLTTKPALISQLDSLFTSGVLHEELESNPKLFMLVLDNLGNFYFGIDLVEAVELVCLAAHYNSPRMLLLLPRGKGHSTLRWY
jgi:hypothetical protein